MAAADACPVTAEDVAFYQREGYLVLREFASAADVAALLERGAALLAACDPEANPSVFSTKRQTATTDEYFLCSGNNISFFMEEGALDDNGRLTKPKELAVNKFGHALHDLDPVFTRFSRSPKMRALLRALGQARPTPVQSMYITKQPDIGGVVVPHQDSAFLHTEPDTCVGVWVALEAATLRNGCLWALPQSHAGGVARRFVLTPQRTTRWAEPEGGGAPGPPSFPPLPDGDSSDAWVPLEVPAGAAVVLHGALVHASKANTSAASRHAYSVHFVEADARWAADNWMHRAPSFPPVPLDEEAEAGGAGA